MNFMESLTSALQNLKGNKIRSFLTMLGIVIGISSVIALSAIGKGGQQNITGNLKQSGYGKFIVSVDKDDDAFRWKYLFSDVTIEKLKDTNLFKNISPNTSIKSFTQLNGSFQPLNLEVTTQDFEEIEPLEYVAGRPFLPFEYENGEKIVVIDDITSKQLFGNDVAAIGKTISFSTKRNKPAIDYTVVGVFKHPLGSMFSLNMSRRIPRYMRIPLRTYDKIYDVSENAYSSLIVESKNPESLSDDMTLVIDILNEMNGVENLYEVNTKNTAAESFDAILSTLNILLTFVAGISLFVGGIGVMNIMLINVIERTKEIGIRKAIGATNKDILIQFLVESVILTSIGGVTGIIIGFILAHLIGFAMKISPIFSATSILGALLTSTFIGIVFGSTPAKKASNLNPVEALRTE